MKYHYWHVRYLGSLSITLGSIWFKLFGYGLAFDIDLPVFYSERHGFRKVHRFGRLAVQVLR